MTEPDWVPADQLPPDSMPKLLTVEISHMRYVTTGGYDHAWCSKCWLISNSRYSGGEVVAWAELPRPYQH